MKDCTYYDLLGVPKDATQEQIADAKNFLVKKFHPDANIDTTHDTTPYIQNILEAYHILSDPDIREDYDRQIRNLSRRNQSRRARARKSNSEYASPNFAPYWEAANKLNELVSESTPLLKTKLIGKQELPMAKLIALAAQADPHITTLTDGNIPREYWHSNAINWLLFQWSQNRDLPYPLLFTMYQSYLEQNKSALEKRKLTTMSSTFLQTLDRLMTVTIPYREVK